MNKNSQATLGQSSRAETTEELIGILTAISVVSKRMAKKLTLLEQQSTLTKGGKCYGQSKRLAPNAD